MNGRLTVKSLIGILNAYNMDADVVFKTCEGELGELVLKIDDSKFSDNGNTSIVEISIVKKVIDYEVYDPEKDEDVKEEINNGTTDNRLAEDGTEHTEQ